MAYCETQREAIQLYICSDWLSPGVFTQGYATWVNILLLYINSNTFILLLNIIAFYDNKDIFFCVHMIISHSLNLNKFLATPHNA